jgi:CRISPR/Cas system-associated endonuclease Cas1
MRHYRACGRLGAADAREAIGKLRRARAIEDIMRIEALWGALSWGPLAGLRLEPRSGRSLPMRLAAPWSGRVSGRSPRNATTGINAMLNLCYTREAARLGALLAANGASLAVGLLHADSLGRHSLIYDALEPLRPLIDARVIRFIRDHRFTKGDYHLLSDGHVRLTHELIAVLLPETMLPQHDIEQAAAFMISLIKKHGRT